uniref:YitT family protein n=1 Tax=Alistipes indistinctus TaxID=626932 RepID=UPI004029E39B
MKQLDRQSVLRTFKEYFLISVGLLMYAFAWICILMPAEVMGGGVNGVGLLIYYGTGGPNGGVPLGITFLVINGLFVLLGSLLISLRVGAKTVYAILFLSASLGFLQGVLPSDLLGLANDKMLSAILGGAVAGAGVSICFMQGGNSGGMDIIAMIINKYKTISYGRILMTIDMITIGCSIFVLGEVSAAIYGFVMVATFGYTIDAVMAGNRQSTQILIVSQKWEEIASRIYDAMHRGVTLIDGQGWYSKKPLKLVMVVCRKNESNILFQVIKEVDPNAFMTFGSVMGVYGLGFVALKK